MHSWTLEVIVPRCFFPFPTSASTKPTYRILYAMPFFKSFYVVNFHATYTLEVLLQIDTKDILFICGGAFIDLEKTISERLIDTATSIWFYNSCYDLHSLYSTRRQDSSIGFGAPVRANMRSGGLTNAVITSSLLESVSESGVVLLVHIIPVPQRNMLL